MTIQFLIKKGTASVINKYCNNKTGFIANMEIAPNLWRIVYDDGKGEDFEELEVKTKPEPAKTEYKNWRKKQMSKKLEKEIEKLKKRIEELEGKQPKAEPAELPFWMPTKDEEKYYYLSFHGVESTTFESGYHYDQQKIAIGNYFKTEELGQKHVDKLKLLEEIKQWRGKYDPDSFKLDWEDEDSGKNALVYDVRDLKWDFSQVVSYNRAPLVIYLSWNAPLNDFLEHFGNRLDILLEAEG
jgi:hypothetical protein